MAKKVVELTRSEFSEKFLYLNGYPFSLADYPHMYPIYNSEDSEVVLHFSRQTAKSTTLANIKLSNAAMIKNFQSLYISPSVDQTKLFSHDRVAPVIEQSPILKKHYVNSSLPQNVFRKQFLNGSKLYLRYVFDDGSNIRGYSADMNVFDETQDLIADTIPVVQETMSRSLYKRTIYAGTPKRTRGTLADIWERSTKNEYAIKCEACNHWNILDDSNIGKYGVICSKCGKKIDVKKGQWVSTYSRTHEVAGTRPIGYRVCALHFENAPWVDWGNDILKKMETRSKAVFFNETLAIAYDAGVTPITKMEIQECCDLDRELKEEPSALDLSYSSVMGIDYGPQNSEKSFTVITILQRRNNKYHLVYAKKFTGKEANYSFIHREIPRLMRLWKCTHLAADYGMGEAPNAEIRSRMGYERVVAFQHLSSQKEKVKWNSKMPAYTLNRNQTMNDLFSLIKRGRISFPMWRDFEPFANDMLNIQADYDEKNNKMKYISMGSDDFFHSMLFGVMALELKEGGSLIFD